MSNVDYKTQRFLLIEDNMDHQHLIKHKLTSAGITNITLCKDGEEGINKIKTGNSFDIILIDFSLPGKTGLEIAEEIKQLEPTTSILMITGQGSEKIAVQAMKAGIEDYITKDDVLRSNELINAIDQIIKKRMSSDNTLSISRELMKNPKQLSISIFRFGQFGPEPIYKSQLPFDLSKEKEDAFYLRIGLYYMTSIGAGHTFAEGLYELPVPDYDDFHGLVFGFRMKDTGNTDSRFEQIGKNYGLIVIIYPKIYRSIIPDHASLETKIAEVILEYADMNSLAQISFIDRIRRFFLELRV